MNNTLLTHTHIQFKQSAIRWKEKDLLEDNPIGLSRRTAAFLIDDLDCHCSSLFVLFHQYQKHHWLVEGPQFMSLHLFLEENYQQVHNHVDEVAERITVLGGIPASSPVAIANKAYIDHEEEGVFHVRDMLRLDLLHEQKIAMNLCRTIQKAGEFGDYGTRHLLEKVLNAVENRAHHLDHFLGNDTLESTGKNIT